jgi:predicted transcriptional regulator
VPQTANTITTRIDSDLKEELQRIAKAERRSASFIANQAIENLVAERRATRELVELGMQLAEQGASSIPAEDIHSWILAEDDTAPFPAGTRTS